MEDITRQDINKILESLRKDPETSKLADTLENADIIPNLMIATYVKAVNRAIKTIEIKQDDEQDGESINGLDNENNKLNLVHVNYAKSKLEAVKVLFECAEERKDLICEFEDSKHPRTITGRCQYEDHYEDMEVSEKLTEDELKEWEKINDEENWYVACDKFKDKLNPEDQTLTITLNIDDEQHKFDDRDPEYVCERCMEVVTDNGCGFASCDME